MLLLLNVGTHLERAYMTRKQKRGIKISMVNSQQKLLILDVIDEICPYFTELDAIYSKSVGFSPPHKRQSGAVSPPPAITSSPLPDLHTYLPNPPPPCSTATPVCHSTNVDTPEAYSSK